MEEGSKDGRKEIPNGTAVDDENQSKENAQKSIQDGVNANKSNGTAVDDENQSKENANIPEDEPLKDISEKKSNGTDVDDENQSKERGPIQTKGNNSNKENQFQNALRILRMDTMWTSQIIRTNSILRILRMDQIKTINPKASRILRVDTMWTSQIIRTNSILCILRMDQMWTTSQINRINP
eukprot:813099_1